MFLPSQAGVLMQKMPTISPGKTKQESEGQQESKVKDGGKEGMGGGGGEVMNQ